MLVISTSSLIMSLLNTLVQQSKLDWLSKLRWYIGAPCESMVVNEHSTSEELGA